MADSADDRAGTTPAPNGLAAVLAENRPVLLRFLERRLGSHAEAEDVLQTLWIKLAERPPTGPIADPLAYLFKMSENAARDMRRAEGRRHVREERWVEAGGAPDAETVEPSPEQQAIDRDDLRVIEARLARLPERTRRLFIAFRLDGTPQKDLARQDGISVSAVQKHLQRAYRAVLGVPDEENDKTTNAQGRPR